MSAAGTRAARGPPPAATTRASSLERRTLLVDTLTVLKFPEADGADRMIHKLEDLQKQELIQIVDAAIVSWPPRKEQAQDPPAQQPGRFWCPGWRLLGAALRADLLRPHLRDGDRRLDGRHERRLRRHRHLRRLHKRGARECCRGTSALFLLSRGAVVDSVAKEVKGLDFEIIETNLPKEQEEKLREAFAV